MTNIIICLIDSYNLAQQMAVKTKHKIIIPEMKIYSGREYLVNLPIQQNLGSEVTIIHNLWPEPNEKLIQLLMLADCCVRSGAHNIKLVTPYLPYLRQDRQLKPYANIGASVVANIFNTTNINKVVTIDPHSQAAESFFKSSLQAVYSIELIADFIKKNFSLKDLILLSPDKGGYDRVSKISTLLSVPYAFLNKKRLEHQIIVEAQAQLPQKQIILIDDIIDSGNTILRAAEAIHSEDKEISVIATHALNKENLIKLANSPIIKNIAISSSMTYDLRAEDKIQTFEIIELLANKI